MRINLKYACKMHFDYCSRSSHQKILSLDVTFYTVLSKYGTSIEKPIFPSQTTLFTLGKCYDNFLNPY